jgi:hypothetical protein
MVAAAASVRLLVRLFTTAYTMNEREERSTESRQGQLSRYDLVVLRTLVRQLHGESYGHLSLRAGLPPHVLTRPPPAISQGKCDV